MLRNLKEFLTGLSLPPVANASDERSLQLATAVLLAEMMRADAAVSDEERKIAVNALRDSFALNDTELGQLLALGEQTASEAYDLHRFTSLLNRELSAEQKVQIIENLWQVAYADDYLSADENHLMRKVAALLYIPHADYVGAKMRANKSPLLAGN